MFLTRIKVECSHLSLCLKMYSSSVLETCSPIMIGWSGIDWQIRALYAVIGVLMELSPKVKIWIYSWTWKLLISIMRSWTLRVYAYPHKTLAPIIVRSQPAANWINDWNFFLQLSSLSIMCLLHLYILTLFSSFFLLSLPLFFLHPLSPSSYLSSSLPIYPHALTPFLLIIWFWTLPAVSCHSTWHGNEPSKAITMEMMLSKNINNFYSKNYWCAHKQLNSDQLKEPTLEAITLSSGLLKDFIRC